QNVSNWLSREEATGTAVSKVLLTFPEVNPEWLEQGSGPMLLPGQGDGDKADLPSVGELRDVGHTTAELIHIPLAYVKGSCGEGEEPFSTEIESYMAFDPLSIRRELGVDPSRLVIIPVSGNSMKPTLWPGERV